jgi:hypothetical protein
MRIKRINKNKAQPTYVKNKKVLPVVPKCPTNSMREVNKKNTIKAPVE